MTGLGLIAVAAYGAASAVTAARALMQNPRVAWAPSVPNLEGVTYDILALVLGLRALVIFQGQVQPALSELFVAGALFATAAIGAGKVVFYAISGQLGVACARIES